MEKVWQAWCLVKPYLLGLLVVLVVAGAIWALISVPKMQVPVCPPGQDGLPPKICFDIENEARKTLAYIMAGVLAIIGIYMGFRRIRASENQVRSLEQQVVVAQEGQITERFTRAIEQLGSDRMEIRLGGIYALERIANDSDKDYWPIMETLTAYVRERAPWRESTPEIPREAAGEQRAGEETTVPETATAQAWAARPKPTTDIQAILTVLGRRKYHYGQGESKCLDLRITNLRGVDLEGAHLEGGGPPLGGPSGRGQPPESSPGRESSHRSHPEGGRTFGSPPGGGRPHGSGHGGGPPLGSPLGGGGPNMGQRPHPRATG